MQPFTASIAARPDFAFLKVTIPAEQTLLVEQSSMAAMDEHIHMKTKLRGGLRRLLTSESMFINEFTARGAPGDIMVAPGLTGDIEEYVLNGQEKFYLTGSAFLAATSGVSLNTKWQGMVKGFFSGESFFLIECTGVGQLWFNCFGAVLPIDVEDELIVDTGHIVAFTQGLDYQVDKLGGYKSLFFSGEGLIARFRGQGRVWVQSKRPHGFVSWADRFRPVKRSND